MLEYTLDDGKDLSNQNVTATIRNLGFVDFLR